MLSHLSMHRFGRGAFFPKAILDLEPITVSIHSERGPVQLVLGGGFHIFGVTALPSGVPAEGDAGDIRLIPGLWYFDTEYDEDPKARRRIQRLVQKGMSAYARAHIHGR